VAAVTDGDDQEDERLLGLIKHQWLASNGVYGHRKVTRICGI
jgi:hypothetical protein